MKSIKQSMMGCALAALAVTATPMIAASPVAAQAATVTPNETLTISQNSGTLVKLSAPVSDIFIANDTIADVQVRSNREIYIFGRGPGSTSFYATGANGNIVYAANVQVGNNVGSIDQMLGLAMPEARIQATNMNNLVLLTGTVASPEDAEEAERLVQAYVGDGAEVVSRLRQATPLQVNLKVRIAEVNRTLLKQIGVNLLTSGGDDFNFGVSSGSGIQVPTDGGPAQVLRAASGTTASLAGDLFGIDLLASLDLAETDGLVSTLAEPNLTALSGETASFLAGGEFPIPISQSLGTVSVEYKQFGVGLAFTPIVLADGRISMRVRPEVSELSSSGAIRLNGYDIPAITTRRAETTVELGSGQSFMIAGLLQNTSNQTIEKAPFLGDIPILGALFRSTQYRKAETELVIIVTPYLVRPVSGQMALPTDGYRTPTEAERIMDGRIWTGRSGPGATTPTARSTSPNTQPGTSQPIAASTAPQPGFGL